MSNYTVELNSNFFFLFPKTLSSTLYPSPDPILKLRILIFTFIMRKDFIAKGPSINYVVSGWGQKLLILPSKKTTKRGGEGVKNCGF